MQFAASQQHVENGFGARSTRAGPSRAAGRSTSSVHLGGSLDLGSRLQNSPLSPRPLSPSLCASRPLSPRPASIASPHQSQFPGRSLGACLSPTTISPRVHGASPPRVIPRVGACSSSAGSVACFQPLSAVAKHISSKTRDVSPTEPMIKRSSALGKSSTSLRSYMDRDSSASTIAPPHVVVQCAPSEQSPSSLETSPARARREVLDGQSPGPQISQDSSECSAIYPRPQFVKFVRVVQAIFRLQRLVEVPTLPEAKVEAMLQRIRVSLETDKAYRHGCEEVFNSLKVSCVEVDGILVFKLPLSQLGSVLNRWQIPHNHIGLFWSILRKLDRNTQEQVLPDLIDANTFSLVLGAFLRRVRNRHSTHIARKDHFIVRNQRMFEKEYQEKGTIGSGSFGECIWVEHRFTKRRYACKRISMMRSDVGNEEVEAELEVMKRLDHPNVLRVFEWFETDSMYALVLEPAYGGDLKCFLNKVKSEGDSDGLEEPLVVMITLQVLHALAYMHSQQVIHRDVKPANMLLANELRIDYKGDDLSGIQVLLADFGLAELFGESVESKAVTKTSKDKKTALCGTLAYMGLEVFNGETTAASDMWALGISVYELFTHQRPIKVDNQMAFYVALKRKNIELEVVREKNASDGALQFLESVLKREASLRPCAKEALEMHWFRYWFEDSAKHTSLMAQKKFKHSISQFRRANTFCKAIAVCSASQLDSSQLAELNKVFKSIDTDNQGTLSREELKQGLHQIGLEGADGDSIFDALDIDRDGTVNYSEFIASLIPTQGIVEDEILARTFSIFDTDGNGSITSNELRSMLCGQSPMTTMLPEGTTVEDMLKDIDSSGDGVISYEEFKSYFHTQQSHDYRRNAMEAERKGVEEKIPWGFADSNGSTMSRAPDQSNGREPIRNVFESIGIQLSMQCNPEDLPDSVALPDFQSMCEKHAHRLAEQHWLVYVSDLLELKLGDWPQLGLPLKLQSMVKARIGVA